MHARLDRGVVKLLTRTGLDWTHKYPPIAAAVSSLGVRQAYLGGELCGVFPDGITSFSMIHAASDAATAAGLKRLGMRARETTQRRLLAYPLLTFSNIGSGACWPVSRNI
jgi:hypothetical protein